MPNRLLASVATLSAPGLSRGSWHFFLSFLILDQRCRAPACGMLGWTGGILDGAGSWRYIIYFGGPCLRYLGIQSLGHG